MSNKDINLEEMEGEDVIGSELQEDTDNLQETDDKAICMYMPPMMGMGGGPTVSTKVELLARYVKESGKNEELERLGIETSDEKEYEYDYFVIDLRDVTGFNRVGDGNTFVRMHEGTVWYVDLNYSSFKVLYENVLNTKIIKPDEVI